MDILKASLTSLVEQVQLKKISARELTEFYLQRIQKLNPTLNAYVHLNTEALANAEAIDKKISQGQDLGILVGMPFGIKDMLCTKGLETTAGSKILENFVPPYDSTVVAKLKNKGAIVLGKLNQDEFAMGSSNETSIYGPSKNPWNLECTPGGSSGGSAAAQAAGLAAATIGTDTGGSIRQPASFCGVVGVKPTYGRVSRYGIIAYASSLDQAGPLTKNVRDSALIMEAICGYDPKDATSSQRSVPQWSQNLSSNIKGMKVGILKEFITDNLDSDVYKTFQDGVEALKKQGADIVEVSVPYTKLAVSVYYLIAASEASSNLARYDGVKYGYRANFENLAAIDLETFYGKTRADGFGPEVKRRLMLGTYCLSSGYFDAFYNKAGQVRRLMTQQYLEAFKSCDVILSPVATTPAFKLGEKIADPLSMYLNDIFTTSTNLAGLPAMSVPFGASKSGLPIGIQIQASHFQEQKMLDIALALEESSLIAGSMPHGV